MSTTNENQEGGHGGRWVYAKFIRLKDGRVIYPKGAKVFRFWVKD